MSGRDTTGDAHAAARAGFDELAARYDEDMRRQAPIVDRFRRVLHRAIERWVAPDASVLELGCGSGEETLYLARTGRRVIATDIAPEMVRVTREKLAEAGLLHRLIPVVGAGPGLMERRAEVGPIDAVVSSLGPLNCEPDLEGLGAALRRVLPAGAPLVLSPMARHCPWEVVSMAARGKLRQAVRRLGRGPVQVPVGSTPVPVWYYPPREFIRRLGPGFRQLELRGLGVFLPPPYLYRLDAVPGLLPVLDRLDDRLAHRPLLRELGDHSLIVLERV